MQKRDLGSRAGAVGQWLRGPGVPGTVQSKALQPGLGLAELEELLTLRQCVHDGS